MSSKAVEIDPLKISPSTISGEPIGNLADRSDSSICLHPAELAHRLAVMQADQDRGFRGWSLVRDHVSEVVHQGMRETFQELVREYPFFDPDHDQPGSYFAVQRQAACHKAGRVIEMLDSLATRAQYRRLQPSEITDALRTASAWGLKLKVRFKDFRRLRVYVRGSGLERRSRREWYLLFMNRHLSVPVYRQVLVIYEPKAQTNESKSTICLRMFKNVPHADLDMMLPGTIRISWADSGRIGIPTAWGFAMMVSKLARNLWLLALLGAMKILTSLTFLVAVIIATAVYAGKVFFSYRNTRNRHLLNVTRNLYYQTLSNNRGVLLRLLDEAEQQVLCQAFLLLYVMETQHPAALTMEALDGECESILTRLALGPINFDIRSSLEFLVSIKLVVHDHETWRLAGPVLEAI
jgi:hypothetical protein